MRNESGWLKSCQEICDSIRRGRAVATLRGDDIGVERAELRFMSNSSPLCAVSPLAAPCMSAALRILVGER